jgi:hypothetical protein
MPFVVESTGEENANLYKRGVNEGSRGELLDASELLELLDVFGEDFSSRSSSVYSNFRT